jgi:glycosyltransferase involved in cell wall biosynthesis
MPIRIVHLITTLETGGAELMLERLLCHMRNDEFSNEVVSLTDIGSVGRRLMDQGIGVHALSMPIGRLTLGGLVKLWRLLGLEKPNILQTWLYHADLLGLIFGKLAGISNICWNIRCSYIELAKYRTSTKWTIRLCSFLSGLPAAIITNSREAVKFHINLGYKANRWKVIPNGFDVEKFKPREQAKAKLLGELGLSHKGNTKCGEQEGFENTRHRLLLIGFVARYDPMKDHSTFIKAACLVLQKRRNVHFVLAGRDVTWGNKIMAGQIPDAWKDHFHLLGERKDIENITAALDIASSVSYGEGFPNIIGEAMASGVPCVVTDVGDSAAIVGDTGYVVPPNDAAALSSACLKLIEMGGVRREELGRRARKRIGRHYALADTVREYEKLYTTLVKRRRLV